MAGYVNLIEAMQAVIKRNGREEITGQILQDVIRGVILELGAGAQFGGIATPETVPGTPDYDIAYIAGEGSYPNFGDITIPSGNIGIITNKNANDQQTWSLSLMEIQGGGGFMEVENVEDGEFNALLNHYYNVQSDVETLSVSLPTPTEGVVSELKVHFYTGFNPTLNINGGSNRVVYSGKPLKHCREYVLTFTYNGAMWNITTECLTPSNCLAFISDDEFDMSFYSEDELTGRVQYSTDGLNWNDVPLTQEEAEEETITAQNDGMKYVVFLRGINNNRTPTIHITTNGLVDCVGEAQYILDYNATALTRLTEDCFAYMFEDCEALRTAPELPSVVLAEYCYNSMFRGCTNLLTAPELPATELAERCYSNMFKGSGVVTAPELPATTTEPYCYAEMFSGCTNLTTAPELPATTLADGCYSGMFYGCTNLTTPPQIRAEEAGENSCTEMFMNCEALRTAPELPATTIAPYCYFRMFEGCTKLLTAPELPAMVLAEECYGEMFRGCGQLQTAPELSAPILADRCYKFMFMNCNALESVRMYATELGNDSLERWLEDVAPIGTFVKISSTNLEEGASGIPYNWTVVNA